MKKAIFLKTMLAATVMLLAGMNLKADNVNYVFKDHYSNSEVITSGTINSSINFIAEKNSAGTAPTVYTADGLRLYAHSASGSGASITLLPQNGAVITQVVITASSTSYTPPTTYYVDGGSGAALTWSSTTGTISGISSSTGLKIQNTVTGGTTQLRIVSVDITYTASSCNDADLQFGITRVVKLETDASFTYAATSTNGSAGAIAYESTDLTVATVDAGTGEVTIAGAGTADIKATIAGAGGFCADETSYTLKVYPGINAKTYAIVTSNSEIEADAGYLLVGIKGSEYYALGWQKSGNRHAIETPVANNEVTTGVATTVTATQDEIYPYEITLKNSGYGYMLYDALHAGYLRPNDAGANGLYTNAQEAYWTIDIDDSHADIECTGSADGANFGGYVFMRFNATNTPPLFNCYNSSSGQTHVYLYKEVANQPADTDPPTLSFSPANGATDVPVGTTVEIASNEPLRKTDGGELTDSDLSTLIVLKETNASGAAIPFTATINATKDTVTVTPTSALDNSQLYYVAIDAVADTAGNQTSLEAITFTTEAGTAPSMSKFVKITSMSDLTDGYYVVTGNGYNNAMTATGTNYLNVTAVTPVIDTIENPDASIIWEIKADNGKHTISNGTNYAAYYGSGNNAYMVTTLNDSARWTVTYGTNEFVINNVKTANRILQYNSNSGQERFACYTNTQKNITLYKQVTDNQPADTDAPILTFDPVDGATDIPVGTTVEIASNEPLRKTDGGELTNSDLSTLIVFKETNASGAAIPFTATINATKDTVTVTPSSPLVNSQLYYVAIDAVADTATNQTTLKAITFTTEAGTPPSVSKFVKITSMSDLTDGYYVVTGNGYNNAMTNTGTNYLNVTAVTPVIDTIENPDASIIWEIKADNGKHTISNGTNYAAYYGSGNNAYLVTALNDSARWTVTYGTNEFVINNVKTANRILQYNSNSGQERFACYTNTQKNITLYKQVTNNQPADTDAPILTFDPVDGATDIPVGTTVEIASNEPLRKTDGGELTDGDLSTLIIFKKTDASGIDVTFTATINTTKDTVTVTPSAPLANSQLYYVAIDAVADTAGNQTSLQPITFTTEAQLSSDADLLEYDINNQISRDTNSTDKTVSVVMPAGTDVTDLTATFTVSTGAAVTVAGVSQVSGTTANDFTNPVVYTIVSQDGSVTKTWTVTVTVMLSPEADIVTFVIPNQVGGSIIDADEATVLVTMPLGTDVTNLVPTITISDYAAITPLSGVAQNFTNTVEYTVTAQDGTVKQWNTSVIFTLPPPSSENLIISFTLPGQTENTIIDSDNRTVTVPMPVGISLAGLIPAIYISPGATISPSAGTIRDFSNPVTYTVTSESGISALWIVKVQQGSADDGLLFAFINGSQIFHIENKSLGIGKIDIYANDGRLMYSGKRGNSSEFNNTEFNIDMSGYAGGMYIIRIFDSNYAFTKTIKIIK